MPVLEMELGGHPVNVYFDTGWPGIMLYPSGLPDLPPSDRVLEDRLMWQKPNQVSALAPLPYRIAGRRWTYPWAERSVPSHRVFEDRGLVAVVGIGAVAHLAGHVGYNPNGQLCLSTPPCTSAPKAWIAGRVAGRAVRVLVDSGSLETSILGMGVSGPFVDIDQVRLPLEPLGPPPSRNRRANTGIIDGKTVDVVVGWRALRDLAWDWNVCTGAFGLRDPEHHYEQALP